jgi:hypothetical protein
MFCGFSFSILSSPSVESSETILLRRLILRLINQNSLYASLANERTPHVAPVLLGEEIICFASTAL